MFKEILVLSTSPFLLFTSEKLPLAIWLTDFVIDFLPSPLLLTVGRGYFLFPLMEPCFTQMNISLICGSYTTVTSHGIFLAVSY